MNTLNGTQEPPSGQGWIPSGTCGGRWSRVLPNGIWETWTPLPEGQVIIATSATAGSQWGLNAPASMDGGPLTALAESSLTAHEVRAMVIEIGALRARNAALEAIEYGSPNPDEARAALERAREVARVHPHADTCATELSPNAGYPCSCWRGDLIVALTMPAEVEAI